MHSATHRLKLAALSLVVSAGCAMAPDAPSYRQVLNHDLATVDYADGIDRLEAKAIGIAYAYQFVNGPAHAPPIVEIRQEGAYWIADIFLGTLAGYLKSDLAPIYISKDAGSITWTNGPDVQRLETVGTHQNP